MCLYYNEYLTKGYLSTRRGKTVTLYKRLDVSPDSVTTPIKCQEIKGAGVIRCKGRITTPRFQGQGMERGLHLYLKNMVSMYCKQVGINFSKGYTEVSIPVKVNVKDIVALGHHNDVVVRKYTISARQWQRLKRLQRKMK